MPKPTLSVVIAAYNEQEYLPFQLNAILSQSRPCDELVMLDDGSTDRTGEIMASVNGRTKLCYVGYRPSAPSGVIEAFNSAVRCATGDWLYVASANDEVKPRVFETWYAWASSFPNAKIIAGDLDNLSMGWTPGPSFIPATDLYLLWRKSQLHGAAVFIKRECWTGYLPQLEWLADWFLNTVTALRHGLYYVKHPMAMVRRLPNSYFNLSEDAERCKRVANEVKKLVATPEYADVAGLIGLLPQHIRRYC